MSAVLGFQPIENKTLTCVNCDKELVELVLISKEIPYKWGFRADCPYCGDSSEWLEKTGKYLYNGVDPVKVVNAEVDKQDDTYNMRFKTSL